jgi:hypothetical protein
MPGISSEVFGDNVDVDGLVIKGAGVVILGLTSAKMTQSMTLAINLDTGSHAKLNVNHHNSIVQVVLHSLEKGDKNT